MTVRFVVPLAFAAVLALSGGARADGVGDLGAELTRLDGARAEVEGRRAALDRKNQEEAREIERLKGEPSGVGRDYRLGQLLASAQERALELDRLQADLRTRDEALAASRRRLLAACDRALEEGKLPDARRVEIARLRAVEAGRLAGSAPSGGVAIARPVADPLDGPSELGEKADLLKDSEDRLRREVDRLGRRIDSVEMRRRLRERAGAVDDDLFVESDTGRRTLRVTPLAAVPHTAGGAGDAKDGAQTPTAGSPNGPPPGGGSLGFGSTGGETFADPRYGVSLRGVIDPSTLDDLRRAEAGADLEGQLRALHRMQGGLKSLADDLGRREGDLRKRAREIRPRK